MRVLFIVPLFHTNLHQALQGLLTHGVTPTLLVRAVGPGRLAGVDVVVRESLDVAGAKRLLTAHDPDLVVIRKTPGLARPVHHAGLMQGRTMLGYDLRPYLRPRHPLHRLEGLWCGRPGVRMTPVHGLPASGSRPDRAATYLPFAVSSAAAGTRRTWLPEGTARILCVGKLAEARKNQPALIHALEALADNASFTLTLVGSSSLAIGNPDADRLAWLRSYPDRGRLGRRVQVLEDVPFDAMTELYATHDLCVLPSRAEPLGIAPLEAMGQGCAALISTECGSAWYVESGKRAGLPCGDLFDPARAGALEAALGSLLQPPSRLAELGRNALTWTQKAFSAETFATGFLALARSRGIKCDPP